MQLQTNFAVTLPQAIREFFNIPQSEMMKTYKSLTVEDKQEIKAGLIKNGIVIRDAEVVQQSNSGEMQIHAIPEVPVVTTA